MHENEDNDVSLENENFLLDTRSARFDAGTRVLCKISARPERWEAGFVVSHNVPHPNSPERMFAYEAKLDSGIVVYAPKDNDHYIRLDPSRDNVVDLESTRRFHVGARVTCKYRNGWETGTIVRLDTLHPEKPNTTIPYDVQLDSGIRVWAPKDTNNVIRPEEPPLRFAVGDRVTCKTNCDPVRWEVGSIQGTNLLNSPTQTKYTPYNIQLDCGRAVYAHTDSDRLVRAYNEPAMNFSDTQPPKQVANQAVIHETNQEDSETLCVICMSATRTHAFVPCGHHCVCEGCSNILTARRRPQCPLCRKYINCSIKIFG